MKKSRGHSMPLLLEPRALSGQPLYRRLYRRIREGVLNGAIAPGTRLPSARTLAREEGISRNTVESALQQLRAEGFLVRRVGSGTYVRSDIRPALLRPLEAAVAAVSGAPRSGSLRRLSRRGEQAGATSSSDTETPAGLSFSPCLPGLEAIPLDSWKRIAARQVRRGPASLLAPPPAGLPALREAIAGYANMNRGVRCSPEQVVVLNSTQQAIDLTARLLLDPGDDVWFEDPGYVSARNALLAAGARLIAVPVDDGGFDVARAASLAPSARLAYVTPSHQYPLGVTLSLTRRLELLEWAARSGAWVLEDDYDSELRYEGRPLASLQGMDGSGRVIYAGTFNKILFPTLRLAYLVLPPELVEPFARAKELADGSASPLHQATLAEFISEGHFSIHLRKVRELYRERRDRLLSVASDVLPSDVRLGPADSGMHVALHLPDDADDRRIAARGRQRGLATPALSSYCIERQMSGLLVHYGNAVPSEIESGIRKLADLLRKRR